ncbi:ABC transporter permease [Geosporobacter ferrireducens]|uniref:Transport permease protein n=1 Tax=Geosporobacter ferrireducens TaxID=1424294 RepID=A0A1D8GF32_9FIRM|nr:ABC transporter permease [Geosporobacter ferrireducens]AOT69512.1 ABC transporter [Geosporobacter ferrireducens]MTI56669.1 ABC transporter permease [Geosporobacter ferrireducens]
MNEIALTKEKGKSRIGREINAIITIALRDITLSVRSPGTIIMSLAMPLVMMGMLGGSLLQNMAGGLGFDYSKYMMVGMMVNMLFMVTTTGMVSLVEDRTTDFTQEMLISPISRYAIVIGKIFGSSFSAIVSMAGTLIVGIIMGITLSPGQLLMILLLSPLMCLSGGALAMIIIGLVKSNKTANIAVMLITMPQMFLSGALIPINNSSGILYVLSHAMPMTYCLDLVRAVVYAGTAEYGSVVLFNPVVNFIAIATLTVICLIIGTFLFTRSEKSR